MSSQSPTGPPSETPSAPTHEKTTTPGTPSPRPEMMFGLWTSWVPSATAFAILPEQETYLALFHGVRRVAIDCDGEAPARQRSSLSSRPSPATLKRWLRRWVSVRHREAAERTVLTAIAIGARSAVLADLLIVAETDRVFADGGHSLDFINKSFECLDLIGWQHAADLLPSVIGQMVTARGADESTEWREPIDLVALCANTSADLAAAFTTGRDRGPWLQHAELAQNFLGDDPGAIIAALQAATRCIRS